MNRMLVVVFDDEAAAASGLQALHRLHDDGAITLYSTGVVVRDAQGKTLTRQVGGDGPVGLGVGLAVGGVIGMLGGPLGVAVGALAGSLAGALRDYWVAGVGMDFVEEAEKFLVPGKAALVAEVEEEWVIPVDTQMLVAGGTVFRRNRAEMAETQFDADIAALRAEIVSLKAELANAGGAAAQSLTAKTQAAEAGLSAALVRARKHADELKHDGQTKLEALKAQVAKTGGVAKIKLEARMARVHASLERRSAKLERAWGLTKEALAG